MDEQYVYLLVSEWYEEHKGSSDNPTNGASVITATLDYNLAVEALQKQSAIDKAQIESDLENFGYDYDNNNLHEGGESYCNGYKSVVTLYDSEYVCLRYETHIEKRQIATRENIEKIYNDKK